MCWVPVDASSDFPLENLPLGVATFPDGHTAVVVRIGDFVLDLPRAGIEPELCRRDSMLNLMASGRLSQVRQRAGELLCGEERADLLQPVDAVECRLPFAVGDFVDFYSSIQHASHIGRLLRPGGNPLQPNWRQLPVGYHGRSGTVVVSGTPVVRPWGLVAQGEGPARLQPTGALDFELEVGFVIGSAGRAIGADEADRHVIGAVLLNDWSARDIQAFEYQPLGPHLAKSFATTISPWVVTLDALAPFLVEPPVQEPLPEPYLRAGRPWGLDLTLEVDLNGTTVTRTGFSTMYWTFAQQLAHLTVNGASVRPGDLFGSGTVSGEEPGGWGCLMEISENGREPLTLDDGSTRTFLADGDTVTLRGWGGREGTPRIGFGQCSGRIDAAPERGW
jgi:fumarylacetoacetase